MKNSILYDTDLIISAYFSDQSTHLKAKYFFRNADFTQEFILNITLQEIATTVSKKFSQLDAKNIVSDIKSSGIVGIFLSIEDEILIWKEFNKSAKNSTSYIDCANLVMARKLNCKVGSFDRFYPKEILA